MTKHRLLLDYLLDRNLCAAFASLFLPWRRDDGIGSDVCAYALLFAP